MRCERCFRLHDLGAWLSLRLLAYGGRSRPGESWRATEVRECKCGGVLTRTCEWETPSQIQESAQQG